MTVPEPYEFRHLDTFPRLRNCTPKLPCILYPPCFFCGRSPLVVFPPSTADTLFASLIVLFLPFSVSVVLCLLVYRVFLRVSSRETIRPNFSVGWHSYTVDLPFRIMTCRFLLAVREIWFVSTCHSRQGISWVRAPLCPCSTVSAFH